ncbi:hypothetical protein MVEN_02441600 [Mycena venus]|uniref:F-box domain-containing protein n=1 Tax=Mycena venus TaxID=2733690 RepID=A0A8H6WYI8_9AGAR|nr:hypothetical protein MVEN_02441600 [Mycena venus]
MYSSFATSPTILLSMLALSMQWMNVNLCLPFQDLAREQFHAALRGRLPALKRLQIITTGGNSVVTAFELAPNLHTVVLERLPPSMPWLQLNHFRGERLVGMDCLHVLRLGVSLLECKFSLVDEDIYEEALLPPHLALRTLHLTDHTVCLDILRILTLPALSELNLDDGRDSVEQYHEVLSFLSRSRPPLQRLSVQHGYPRLTHAFPFLLQLSALEIPEVTVAEYSILLQDLRARDPATFLPNLKSLVISSWESLYYEAEQPASVDCEVLADALTQR